MQQARLKALSAAAMLSIGVAASAGIPQYTIVDIGVVTGTQTASQGLRVSSGGVAVGRTLGTPAQAFSWTQGGGIVGLPNLASPSRPFGAANGVNDLGVAVGTGTTTAFGSSPLPLMWTNGVVSQLPLPAGQTLGRANDVNSSNFAVGSVGSGSTEFGVMYDGGVATVITQTTAGGAFIRTAFSVNDSGLVVGNGIDPNNAARNVGFVYDSETNSAFEVGALPGANGALAFDVSNAGHVVGSSMMNQGSGMPFIWKDGNMTAIPLPVGTSQASARGVNSMGWAVGTASSAFAIPFLYDGDATYRLQDLIPGGSGWDLSTNTSSSAMSISENGIIVGTGVFNGATHAYAMIPVPTPGTIGLFGLAGIAATRRRR